MVEHHIRAKVVEDPGMEANWPGSTDDNIVGFNTFSMTMPSAILNKVDVREIALRSSIKSQIVGAIDTNS